MLAVAPRMPETIGPITLPVADVAVCQFTTKTRAGREAGAGASAGLFADRHVEILDHRLVHAPDDQRVGAGGGPAEDEGQHARAGDVRRVGVAAAEAELFGGVAAGVDEQ